MDVLRFGRWFAMRRRECGFPSQRALAERLASDEALNAQGISTDFLARLEAGHVAHPFRGEARRRILTLATVLCETPQEMKGYLQAAGLLHLNRTEEAQVPTHLRVRDPQMISDGEKIENMPEGQQRREEIMLLPPRRIKLFGCEALVENLVRGLVEARQGIYVVTGMPGVGKSAFMAEVVHEIAEERRHRQALFRAGVAVFTCAGRQGIEGLVSLLNEITSALGDIATDGVARPATNQAGRMAAGEDGRAADAINRVRLALAGKEVLLGLDAMEYQFPLRAALEALLGGEVEGRGQRALIVTSRYIPTPALMTRHQHLEPLEPEAAMEMFKALLPRALDEHEICSIRQICAGVGYVPLALEEAASMIQVGGIELSLLAKAALENPLGQLVDSEGRVRKLLGETLTDLENEQQQHFALLALLGREAFGLESAAALRGQAPESVQERLTAVYTPALSRPREGTGAEGGERDQLVKTAADLGLFVRRSSLECLEGYTQTLPELSTARPAQTYYRLHPLFYTHAMERLEQHDPDVVRDVERSARSFALAFTQHYAVYPARLEQERGFLLSVLERAWEDEEYPFYIQLLSYLMQVLGRMTDIARGERLVRQGVRASRDLHRRECQAFFLYHLGKLLTQRSQFQQAEPFLQEALELGRALPRVVDLWSPFMGLAEIAHHLGNVEAALSFMDADLQFSQQKGGPLVLAGTYYAHAMYSRVAGNREQAFKDIELSQQWLKEGWGKPGTCRTVFDAVVAMEQARIVGNYEQARYSVELALELAPESEDLYTIAEILWEQGKFALEEGHYEDARQYVQRGRKLATLRGSKHLYTLTTNILSTIKEKVGS